MKTWRELTIASKSMDAEALVGLLRVFCSAGGEWVYAEEMSLDYARSCREPACRIQWMGSNAPCKPIVAFVAGDDCNMLKLAAIGASTVDEYNLIATRFTKDLRHWARDTHNEICVKLGKSDVGLAELISSGRARDLFERYLDRCSFYKELAIHPFDLELLDRFTCSLHTYPRKPVNLCELERYLQEGRLWSKDDSRRCIQRVDIGLHVLRLYSPHISTYKWSSET